MKHLFFMLLCISSIVAQQKEPTITVAGETVKEIKVKEYVINIELKEVLADGYQNIESRSLKEVVESYQEMMQGIGVDFKKFEENLLYRITSSYYNKSEYYFYTTSSIDEVQKIISQKMKGLANTWVDIISKDLTNTEIGALNQKAIADAKDRATEIAKTINKRVGAILYIEDINQKRNGFYFNKAKEPIKHQIKVTFALE